jgi:hypothetical protein
MSFKKKRRERNISFDESSLMIHAYFSTSKFVVTIILYVKMRKILFEKEKKEVVKKLLSSNTSTRFQITCCVLWTTMSPILTAYTLQEKGFIQINK